VTEDEMERNKGIGNKNSEGMMDRRWKLQRGTTEGGLESKESP